LGGEHYASHAALGHSKVSRVDPSRFSEEKSHCMKA
jgi:hypothetical protein